MSIKLIGAVAALSLFVAGAANAATLHFTANLTGAAETPATDSAGTGTVTATLNTTTKAFDYSAVYSGLSGPATMAHFHGPAAVGAKGPPVVPVMGNVASPIKGTAVLTDVQITDLEAGMWYFNVHTAAHPGGEVRGQVVSAK
jgi:outer membrane lipoprotein SlyB